MHGPVLLGKGGYVGDEGGGVKGGSEKKIIFFRYAHAYTCKCLLGAIAQTSAKVRKCDNAGIHAEGTFPPQPYRDALQAHMLKGLFPRSPTVIRCRLNATVI